MLRPRAVLVASVFLTLAACSSTSSAPEDAGSVPEDAGSVPDTGGPPTPICTPGALRCRGESAVEVCAEDGFAYAPSTTCSDATPVCLAGECVACTEGTTTCADGASTHTCLADGAFGALAACDAATPACLDGACVVCAPGATVCSDQDSMQTCLADGTYGDVVVCDAATPACSDGLCRTCAPGTTICDDDGSHATCLPDGSGYAPPVACAGATPACFEGGCVACLPGATRCADDATVETCATDGSGYAASTTCDDVDACSDGACVSKCSLAEASPSSFGCSFVAAKLDNFYSNVGNANADDALIVVNPDPDLAVDAELQFAPIGSNVLQSVATIHIDALGHHAFRLDAPEVDNVSRLRSGGVFRVTTTTPVAAFQHTPITDANAAQESMLLLPEHALTGHYVVASYPSTVAPYPSYFTAIALSDGTTFTYRVPQAAAGGTGVPAVAAGGTGTLALSRYDFLNVVAGTSIGGDLSGTIIEASGPIQLVGATECANVPDQNMLFCNVLAEQMVPLEAWGTEYVTARPPGRPTNEARELRVYAGADDVTIDATPAVPGFPITLAKGEFVQVATYQDLELTGNGPFMPVVYLRGRAGVVQGDPAMSLVVPTAQFLDTYVFAATRALADDYAQVVRRVGGADVFVDGVVVTGYGIVGDFEVASVLVADGTHRVTSASPFGLTLVSHTANKSFACPGGMALRRINPQ